MELPEERTKEDDDDIVTPVKPVNPTPPSPPVGPIGPVVDVIEPNPVEPYNPPNPTPSGGGDEIHVDPDDPDSPIVGPIIDPPV